MIIRVSILSLFVLIRLTIFCHGHLMKISDQNRSSERETSSENMPAKLHESSTDIQTSELSITSQFHGQWFPDALPRNNLWTNPFSVLQTTISYPHLNSSKTTPQICQYCSLAELFYNDACTEWPVKKFKTSNRPKEPSSEEISYPGEKFPININVSEDLEERHVFDYYGKVFRRLTCLNGFQFKDEYCVYADINSTLNVKATLIINQNPLIGKRKEYSRKQLFRIAQLLYKTFSVFKLSRILHIAIYQNLLNTSELNVNILISISSKLNLTEYVLKLISLFHNRTLFSLCSPYNFLKKNQSRMEYRFRFGSDNLDKGRFNLVKHFWIPSRNMETGLVYPFSKILYCPMMRLGKNEAFINNISQLCINEFNQCFDSILYYVSEHFQVCKDDYFSIAMLYRTYTFRFYTFWGYLALATWCLSAFCLLITLAIYSICPELRTLSGKCNMFLCFSLMLAQIAIGCIGPLSDFPLLCKISGFFIHYFWLSSFFWMSACSTQMFLLFGRLNINNMADTSKRLPKYCLYAYGTPIFLTGTNIVYSTLSTKGANLGYDWDSCFITYEIMIIVTYAVPVSLILFSNSISFVIVCCRINHHQKIESVQKRYSRSKVLAKLSFLLGSPWILAYVNYWVKDLTIELLFLTLGGCQGLFIMISFVCTRRVFDLLREKLNLGKNFKTKTAQDCN